MNILGIVFALAAGVFFGIIGPVTKTAYNLGAGVGLAIFLRYIVALLITVCYTVALHTGEVSLWRVQDNLAVISSFTLLWMD